MRTPAKLTLLTSLYVSQGLPFGFFTQSLPVLLRKDGVSLAAIGSTSLLALPWMLKLLWAPYVDRYGSLRLGMRRSWILPLQAAAVLLMLAFSTIDPGRGLWFVFAGVLIANLVAATQDIATDALAIDLLSERERGLGNGVQVAGYRVGMIVGGGLLLMVFDRLGWTRSFWLMAGLLALSSLPVWLYREPSRANKAAAAPALAVLWETVRRPELRAFIPVVAFYKAGDAFGTAMLRPWLVDAGYTLSDIGLLLGTVGFLSGLFGALLGGALCTRMQRRRALGLFAVGHALSFGAYALCAAQGTRGAPLFVSLALEHALGGMATAALFTSMMDHARPESAATDYTVLACLVLAGSGGFGAPSGLVAEAVGYPAHFCLAAIAVLLGALVASVGRSPSVT